MSKLLILGAGGLGQMVGEVARAAGNWDGVAFLDDAVRGADVAGKCMDYTSLTGEYPEAVAAFGDNRLRLVEAMAAQGLATYPKDWWHFTLRPEPDPGTAYDFPVR